MSETLFAKHVSDKRIGMQNTEKGKKKTISYN